MRSTATPLDIRGYRPIPPRHAPTSLVPNNAAAGTSATSTWPRFALRPRPEMHVDVRHNSDKRLHFGG